MRENRTHGSEGGDGESRSRPLSFELCCDLLSHALPARLTKDFFDKAIFHQFIDHAIVDDFGSERFSVDAFDGFEFQDCSHISAIDPGCFFSELGDEGVSFFEKIGIAPFEIFCQRP